MKFFFLLLIVAVLISCGRKQEQESTTPTRQESTPDLDDIDLPDSYIKNLKVWNKSFAKECSISHIFKGKVLFETKFDYEVATTMFTNFINSSLNSDKEKSSVLIPHPDWKNLSLDDDVFYQEDRIKKTPIIAKLKDGLCDVRVNGRSILKQKLLKTIPILFSFDETKIKGNSNYSPIYHFDEFKDLKMAINSLSEDPFFNEIPNLIRHERFTYQSRADAYCPRVRSLFTLLKDDSRNAGYRCLYSQSPFTLNAVGISNQGDFLYQIEKDFNITEITRSLKITDYEKNEEVIEFEKKYWPQYYKVDDDDNIEYSLRAINNCHLIINVKKEYLNKIESYDLLLNSNRSDLFLEGQRNNNLIIAKLEDRNEDLVIRFNRYKEAKRIFKELLNLKYRCQ